MLGTPRDAEDTRKRHGMNQAQVKVRNDTPALSILITMAVIIGGFPALIVLATKWADSPQRIFAAGVGIITISLFGLLRRKYDALLIALLFFSQFQISLLSIPLDEPVAFQISFADVLLALFIMAAMERGERFSPDTVGWVFIALIAWQTVSALVSSAHLHRSLIFLFWEVKYLFVYLFVLNMDVSDKLARQIRTTIFLVLFLQGGMAVAQLVTSKPLGLVVFGEQDPSRLFYVKGGLRVSGTLGATNALAGYMAALLVCALPFLFRRQSVLGYACYGTGFSALLFALSRAGWLSFMVGGSIVVGGLLRTKIVKPTRVMVLGLVGTMIIGAGVSLYLDKIQDRFENERAVGSAKGRFYQFGQAWPIVERYPVFGIGAGVTEFYGAWNENERYVRNRLPDVRLENQPHNSQLQYWIESGTPALILFVSIIALAFWTSLRKPQAGGIDSDVILMKIGARGAAVAAMVHASFGTEINHHQITMAFWILLALGRNVVIQPLSVPESDVAGAK
jgi:O-antigen ligase